MQRGDFCHFRTLERMVLLELTGFLGQRNQLNPMSVVLFIILSAHALHYQHDTVSLLLFTALARRIVYACMRLPKAKGMGHRVSSFLRLRLRSAQTAQHSTARSLSGISASFRWSLSFASLPALIVMRRFMKDFGGRVGI